MQHKYYFLNYWKSMIFISVILYLSFAPPSTFNGVPAFENEDKVVHLFLYAVLTCLLIFDFRKHVGKNQPSIFSYALICIVFPVILGGAIEIIQPLYFAPRTAEWLDWFSDISGVFSGWFVMSLINRRVLKRKIK